MTSFQSALTPYASYSDSFAILEIRIRFVQTTLTASRLIHPPSSKHKGSPMVERRFLLHHSKGRRLHCLGYVNIARATTRWKAGIERHREQRCVSIVYAPKRRNCLSGARILKSGNQSKDLVAVINTAHATTTTQERSVV